MLTCTRYMDGRTDRVISIYPPNFVCRGYKEAAERSLKKKNKADSTPSKKVTAKQPKWFNFTLANYEEKVKRQRKIIRKISKRPSGKRFIF